MSWTIPQTHFLSHCGNYSFGISEKDTAIPADCGPICDGVKSGFIVFLQVELF